MSPVLLEPIVGAEEGTADAEYTEQICKLRSRVENTIGIIKMKYQAVYIGREL